MFQARDIHAFNLAPESGKGLDYVHDAILIDCLNDIEPSVVHFFWT